MFDYRKLRAHITESGLKQKYIAQKAGIYPSAFNLILAGKRNCSAAQYGAICVALNVPLETFMNVAIEDSKDQPQKEGA